MRYFVFSILLCFILVGEGRLSAEKNTVFGNQLLQHELLAGGEKNEDLSAVAPLNAQSVANAFRHFKQQNPEYVVLIEFFAENWSTALYKHLIDSGECEPWFINTSFSPKRQRISGWKDGNLLYKKGLFQAA